VDKGEHGIKRIYENTVGRTNNLFLESDVDDMNDELLNMRNYVHRRWLYTL
jgi:hypothetical protein